MCSLKMNLKSGYEVSNRKMLFRSLHGILEKRIQPNLARERGTYIFLQPSASPAPSPSNYSSSKPGLELFWSYDLPTPDLDLWRIADRPYSVKLSEINP